MVKRPSGKGASPNAARKSRPATADLRTTPPDLSDARGKGASNSPVLRSKDKAKLEKRAEELELEIQDLRAGLEDATHRSHTLLIALKNSQRAHQSLLSSTSWRVTTPLRAVRSMLADPKHALAHARALLPGGKRAAPPFERPTGVCHRLTREKREALRALFDENLYLEGNPDVEIAGLDPFYHFLEVGCFEGRQGTRETAEDIERLRTSFDGQYYVASNADVTLGRLDPFEHFVQYGRWEGREGAPPPQLPGQYHAAWGSDYQRWIEWHDANEASLKKLENKLATLRREPLISVVMPVYNTPEDLLRAAIESVTGQIYRNWELCIADDCSQQPQLRAIIEEYATGDKRIRAVFRESNGHISEATNSAFALATGEWVALLDHDDVLRSDSLAEIALAIAANPQAQLIYSDEDKLNELGLRYDPYFKPDYSPELFRSQNYFNHLTVHRAENIRAVGGWRKGFEGSQDYDLTLRILERIDRESVLHIPKVLYHWRATKGSVASSGAEKSYAYQAGMLALRDHVQRLGLPAKVEPAPGTPYYRVRFEPPEVQPLVSLIIPAKDKVKLTKGCIATILEKTSYQNFEILLIDNGSVRKETLAFNARIAQHPKVRVISYTKPFNYSEINNFAAGEARGTLLGLINNDIEVIDADWLTEMVSWAARPDIGCVGAKLIYADKTVQHAGVVLGVGGVADHAYRGLDRRDGGYFGQALVLRNCSAVTGACLVVRKEVFDEVGGLDEENLKIAFNDVDFCLKVQKAGYRNLWTPHAELHHLESQSRGREDNPEKVARFNGEIRYMRRKWAAILDKDPYYSVNLSRLGPPYALAP